MPYDQAKTLQDGRSLENTHSTYLESLNGKLIVTLEHMLSIYKNKHVPVENGN